MQEALDIDKEIPRRRENRTIRRTEVLDYLSYAMAVVSPAGEIRISLWSFWWDHLALQTILVLRFVAYLPVKSAVLVKHHSSKDSMLLITCHQYCLDRKSLLYITFILCHMLLCPTSQQ